MQKKWAALVCAGMLAFSVGHCVPCLSATAENSEQNQITTARRRDPNAGYYELLDANSYFDFCTWLVDEKGLDLNDEQDSAYIDDNLNPLLFEAIDEGIILDITNPNLRWMGITHPNTVSYVMTDLFEKDGKTDVKNFYSQLANDGIGNSLFHYLRNATNDPDINENAWFNKGHFYCYDSPQSEYGGYYKNGSVLPVGDSASYSPTARTRLEQHYAAAVYAWKSYHKVEAMEELGRAIHYISDMGAPTHAINWGRVHFNRHNQYETWVDTVQANAGPSDEDSDEYDYWLPSANEIFYNDIVSESFYDFLFEDFEIISNCIAQYASQYESYLSVEYQGNMNDVMQNAETLRKYNIVTEATLPVVQGMVAGLMNRFYYDINQGQDIQNYYTYYIKNKQTNNYLTVNANNELVISPYNGSDAQKFQFVYRTSNHGFSIQSKSNQGYLQLLSNAFSFSNQFIASRNDMCFMPVWVFDRYYRIMIGGIEGDHILDFECGNMDLVFSRSNSDTLLPAEYYPDEMRQYWEFIPV